MPESRRVEIFTYGYGHNRRGVATCLRCQQGVHFDHTWEPEQECACAVRVEIGSGRDLGKAWAIFTEVPKDGSGLPE